MTITPEPAAPPKDDVEDEEVRAGVVEAALSMLTRDMPDPEDAKARITALLVDVYCPAGKVPKWLRGREAERFRDELADYDGA